MRRSRWIVERRRRGDDSLVESVTVSMTLAEIQAHVTSLTDGNYFTTAVKAGSSFARALVGTANAQLIATAPLMLTTLQQTLHYLYETGETGYIVDDIEEVIRVAGGEL